MTDRPPAVTGPQPIGESRLAGVLTAMSLATDLAMGLPAGHAIRACLVATRFAARIAPGADASAVYYAALLRYVGCTAFAHEEAALAGDDVAARSAGASVDFTRPREAIAFMLRLSEGAPPVTRVKGVIGGIVGGRSFDAALKTANCEVAARAAERLGLGPSVAGPLYQIFERWDGKGVPSGLIGEQIALASRIANLAHVAVLADEMGGGGLVDAVLRDRSGSWLDPELCRLFPDARADVWPSETDDTWRDALSEEPEPMRMLRSIDIARVAAAFGDLADLKSPFLHGHARSVAELAVAAAAELGLDAEHRAGLEIAALLHDIGRVAVASSTWEKAGPLTELEWEHVRMHPYHTERILRQAQVLREHAAPASGHHERVDGSGYHRSLPAAMQPMAVRVLAAADVLAALCAERPHRSAFTADAAPRELERSVASGGLDAEAAEAVLAGQGLAMRRPRRQWPAGLSEREVEVIRLLAAGRSKRQVAAKLFISASTVHTHVTHIYEKIGTSTRAGAALFAMEEGLYLSGASEKSTV